MLINNNYNIIHKNYPYLYPYVKIDNFFHGDIISELENSYPSHTEFRNNKNTVGRMDGDTTSGNSLI